MLSVMTRDAINAQAVVMQCYWMDFRQDLSRVVEVVLILIILSTIRETLLKFVENVSPPTTQYLERRI